MVSDGVTAGFAPAFLELIGRAVCQVFGVSPAAFEPWQTDMECAWALLECDDFKINVGGDSEDEVLRVTGRLAIALVCDPKETLLPYVTPVGLARLDEIVCRELLA